MRYTENIRMSYSSDARVLTVLAVSTYASRNRLITLFQMVLQSAGRTYAGYTKYTEIIEPAVIHHGYVVPHGRGWNNIVWELLGQELLQRTLDWASYVRPCRGPRLQESSSRNNIQGVPF